MPRFSIITSYAFSWHKMEDTAINTTCNFKKYKDNFLQKQFYVHTFTKEWFLQYLYYNSNNYSLYIRNYWFKQDWGENKKM